MDKFKHKLSSHHGTERARIWLEGARLVDAGFTVGERFRVDWTPATLTFVRVPHFEGRRKGFGTVSGKGNKPIIDIVGPLVSTTFGERHMPTGRTETLDYVSVTYTRDFITVRRAS